MCFAFQSVFVYICATESARNLLGVFSAPWPGLACPPTILWSCCCIGRLNMMHIEVFLFLCVAHGGNTVAGCFHSGFVCLRLKLSLISPRWPRLVCLHACLLILPPSITWARLPPVPGGEKKHALACLRRRNARTELRRLWHEREVLYLQFSTIKNIRKTSTRKVLTAKELNSFLFLNVVLDVGCLTIEIKDSQDPNVKPKGK